MREEREGGRRGREGGKVRRKQKGKGERRERVEEWS